MKKVEKISKILVVIAFVILSIFIAMHHEHWSDEAQSFLIARDTSLTEVLGYMKYEGTPALWVMVIKLFLALGGTYETYFIIPIILSTIGVIIFEFKIKAPLYIKILFPFTYFIFYQYTIVARSYCLVFPIIMALAVIFEKRFEKPILYSIILFLFMSISLHTLVIAGSIYLIFLIEVFKNKTYKEKKILIAIILLFFEFLFTALCTFPASDCSFKSNGGAIISHVVSEATMGSFGDIFLEIMITLMLAIVLIVGLKSQKKFDILKFFILFLPITLLYTFINYQTWHVGVFWILIFTYFIMSDLINNDALVKIFMVFVCVIQITWTISSSTYDYKNEYSASKAVADFIEMMNLSDKKIYGLGYSVTAIQPYFEENIFKNQNTDKSFYLWKEKNGYMSNNEAWEGKADVYVISNFYLGDHASLYLKLQEGNYKKYIIQGYTYMKTEILEPEGYLVFVKND